MRKCILAAVLVPLLCAQVPPAARPTRQTRQRQQPQNKTSDLETPAATFHGTVRSISKKEIVLDLPEDQSIAFHISHKTKFLKDEKPVKPAAIGAGTAVTVDGKRDLLGNVEAVSVSVDTKPAAKPGPQNPS